MDLSNGDKAHVADAAAVEGAEPSKKSLRRHQHLDPWISELRTRATKMLPLCLRVASLFRKKQCCSAPKAAVPLVTRVSISVSEASDCEMMLPRYLNSLQKEMKPSATTKSL